jgi:hypothetical protein
MTSAVVPVAAGTLQAVDRAASAEEACLLPLPLPCALRGGPGGLLGQLAPGNAAPWASPGPVLATVHGGLQQPGGLQLAPAGPAARGLWPWPQPAVTFAASPAAAGTPLGSGAQQAAASEPAGPEATEQDPAAGLVLPSAPGGISRPTMPPPSPMAWQSTPPRARSRPPSAAALLLGQSPAGAAGDASPFSPLSPWPSKSLMARLSAMGSCPSMSDLLDPAGSSLLMAGSLEPPCMQALVGANGASPAGGLERGASISSREVQQGGQATDGALATGGGGGGVAQPSGLAETLAMLTPQQDGCGGAAMAGQ